MKVKLKHPVNLELLNSKFSVVESSIVRLEELRGEFVSFEDFLI